MCRIWNIFHSALKLSFGTLLTSKSNLQLTLKMFGNTCNLHVKGAIKLSDLNKTEIVQCILMWFCNNKFHKNPFSGSQTESHTNRHSELNRCSRVLQTCLKNYHWNQGSHTIGQQRNNHSKDSCWVEEDENNQLPVLWIGNISNSIVLSLGIFPVYPYTWGWDINISWQVMIMPEYVPHWVHMS
jgi:hypothetical protein